jgi:hypothetical protein
MPKINDRTFCMSGRFIVLFLNGDRLYAIQEGNGKDSIKKFYGIKSAEKAASRLPINVCWTIREL